jgi:hypothetical protein
VADAVGVGVGVGAASGSEDGLAVADPGVGGSVGLGESVDRGFPVGLGVALTGFAVGFGVGFAVGRGVAFGVGFGVGLGVGFGVGGTVTLTAVGTTPVKVQVVPPLRTTKLYGHDPAGRVLAALNTTPALRFVPPAVMSLRVPLIRRRTHEGAAPVLSATVTLNTKTVEVVPVPGAAIPGPIVSVAQDLASTGETNPTRDMVIQPVSARTLTRPARARRRSIPRNQVSVL